MDMETVFPPEELAHLVSEVLAENYCTYSNEDPRSTLFVLNPTNANVQDLDLETIDIQDLLGGVSWEQLALDKDSSESSNTPVTSGRNTPNRSRGSSNSNNGQSDSGSSSWENTGFLCPVCDNPSGKHFYYGSQVCSSCRAFFRRSTIKSGAKEFRCKANQNCVIDSKSWKSCKFCRFQKCLSAGMKPNWVMNDEERSQRNAKRKRTRAKRVENFASEVFLGHQWTIDEECQIQGIREDMIEKTTGVLAEFYSSNPMILQSFIECANNRTPIDPILLAYSRRFISNERMKVLSDMLVLKKINPLDRLLLLSRNNCLWTTFDETIQVNNYQEVAKAQHNQRKYFDKIKNTSNACSKANIDVLIQALDKISVEDNVECSDFVSDFIHDQQTRMRRIQLIVSIQCWTKFSSQGVSDDILLSLMMMILILCPEALKLQSESLVNQIQTEYCYILYRYINSRYPGRAHSKLGEAMDIVSKVREVTSIQEKALNVQADV